MAMHLAVKSRAAALATLLAFAFAAPLVSAIENCDNGIDDDQDMVVDGYDPDCWSSWNATGPSAWLKVDAKKGSVESLWTVIMVSVVAIAILLFVCSLVLRKVRKSEGKKIAEEMRKLESFPA